MFTVCRIGVTSSHRILYLNKSLNLTDNLMASIVFLENVFILKKKKNRFYLGREVVKVFKTYVSVSLYLSYFQSPVCMTSTTKRTIGRRTLKGRRYLDGYLEDLGPFRFSSI